MYECRRKRILYAARTTARFHVWFALFSLCAAFCSPCVWYISCLLSCASFSFCFVSSYTDMFCILFSCCWYCLLYHCCAFCFDFVFCCIFALFLSCYFGSCFFLVPFSSAGTSGIDFQSPSDAASPPGHSFWNSPKPQASHWSEAPELCDVPAGQASQI